MVYLNFRDTWLDLLDSGKGLNLKLTYNIGICFGRNATIRMRKTNTGKGWPSRVMLNAEWHYTLGRIFQFNGLTPERLARIKRDTMWVGG